MESPIRILIVDDDEVDRMAVRRALLKAGVSIISMEAKTYGEAIALLEDHVFDCTFLDYGLPDRSGLALVKAARLIDVQHPLVVLTGQGDEKIAVDLMKAGATDYLPKSQVSPETLSQVMRNAIRIDRAEREAINVTKKLQYNNELLLKQNRELEEQRAQIELNSLQQSDFIAHLTHDLRTPLVAANLMFKLFKEESFGSLSASMHEALSAMDRSNQNLLDLVNTLLEVHHYESGTKNLTFITCNMWGIVQEVIEELQPVAQYKLLSMTALHSVADPGSLKVLGDCQEIRRMITNLVGNALKFTDVGSVELRLGFEAANVDDAVALNGWVTIEVEDTGPGMPPDEQSVIFQRFRTGYHRQVGSGLGLHLVERIVSKHAGTIRVNSEVGKGSLFKVSLLAHQE